MAQGVPDPTRYIIEGELGSGGMAVVYLARHRELGSVHAIKVLSLSSPQLRARLLQEGRLQASLRHPNILSVTDLVELNGQPALVLEYVEGPSLAQLLAARRLTLAQADQLGREILRGVSAAHRHGLIHRDLKPDNIMLSVADGVVTPKIADFGLAKLTEGDGPTSVRTRSGAAMGTPSFMAPEQIRDASTVDARADVFSLGAILYEMLSGRRAFDGDDTMEIFQRVSEGRCVPLREHVPDLPDRLLRAIDGALQPDRDRRFNDVEQMLVLWTGGAAGAPAPLTQPSSWDAHTLTQIEQLSTRPEPRSAPDPGEERRSDETFIALTALETDSSPPPSSGAPVTRVSSTGSIAGTTASAAAAPPVTRRRFRLWPLGAAALTSLLVVGWLILRGATERGPTMQLQPDATSTERAAFDDARDALLDGELSLAERRARVLLELRPDDPGPHLLVAFVSAFRHRPSIAISELQTAAELAGPRADSTAQLSRLARRSAMGTDDPARVLADWEALHRQAGDDPLALLLQASLPIADSLESRLALVDRAVAAAPGRALVYAYRGWLLDENGRVEEARDALQAGITQAPASPWLHYLLGVSLETHDDAAAKRELLLALRQDGSLTQARMALARLLLREGDEAGRLEQVQALSGPTTPGADRLPFYMSHGHALAWRGRLAEAEALWSQCVEEGFAEAQPGAAARCAFAAQLTCHYLGLPGNQARWLEPLAESIQQPEMNEIDRAAFAPTVLKVEGEQAIAQGDLDAARRRLERLSALDEGDLAFRPKEWFVGDLEIDLLLAEGRGGEALERLDQLSPIARCRRAWTRSRALDTLHDEVALTSQLEEMLEIDCGSEIYGPIFAVLARVRLSELRRSAGDPVGTEAILEQIDALWPDADTDLPLMQRVIALRR